MPVRDAWRILEEIREFGPRAADDDQPRAAQHYHADAACDHAENNDVEGDVNAAASRSCYKGDPRTGSGFLSKNHHQTMRKAVSPKAMTAAGMCMRRRAALASGSSALPAWNPEPSAMMMRIAVSQWIVTGTAP